MDRIYMVLGALSFWSFVTVGIFVGSVYLAELWKDRTYRRQLGAVIDPFTKAQTDRIARTFTERSIG